MIRKNLFYIVISNILGLFIFFSWYMTEFNGLWFEIDKQIFYYFNKMLLPDVFFTYFVAFVNFRAFDLVAFIAMLLIYYKYYRKSNAEGKRWLFCIGIAMLFSTIILKQFDNMLPIDRISASRYFDNLYHDVNFVSEITQWPTKDQSSTSFPGDHGMILLIFSVYMWKYIGIKAFLQGLGVFIIFSLPRIMSGAHWFSDIYAGSISFVLIILSWIILSPVADIVISWLENKIPLRYFIRRR